MIGQKGPKNPAWKGGRRPASNGYVWVYSPDHPYRTKDNRVLEHRLVMEARLGRYLKPHEVVHHRNSVRNDNRDENLELMTSGENVAISNAVRPVTASYRKKRRELAATAARGSNGRFR